MYTKHAYDLQFKKMSLVILFKGFAYTETMDHKIFDIDKSLGKLMKISTGSHPQYTAMVVETDRVFALVDFFGYTLHSLAHGELVGDLKKMTHDINFWKKRGEDLPKKYKKMAKVALNDLIGSDSLAECDELIADDSFSKDDDILEKEGFSEYDKQAVE